MCFCNFIDEVIIFMTHSVYIMSIVISVTFIQFKVSKFMTDVFDMGSLVIIISNNKTMMVRQHNLKSHACSHFGGISKQFDLHFIQIKCISIIEGKCKFRYV